MRKIKKNKKVYENTKKNKCNSPLINGQCTNFILFDVHYNSLCPLKG